MRKVQKKYCGYNVVVLGNRLKFSEIFFYEEVRCLSSSFEFGQACDCFDLEIIEEMMLCDFQGVQGPKRHTASTRLSWNACSLGVPSHSTALGASSHAVGILSLME